MGLVDTGLVLVLLRVVSVVIVRDLVDDGVVEMIIVLLLFEFVVLSSSSLARLCLVDEDTAAALELVLVLGVLVIKL